MRILYEDKALVIVEKLPGMLSEAAEGDPASVITQLNAHFQERGDTRSTAFPIHRLDRNVGGAMVCAKTRAAAGKLSAAVQQGGLIKEYVAALHGAPGAEAGVYEDLLWKDSKKNKTFVVTRPRKGVKEAKLAYSLLQRSGDRSLVQVRLYTGRSHQIRVQFASRKTPLVGDGKYGAKDNEPLALWSCRLRFKHPFTGEALTFSALPETLGGFETAGVQLGEI